MADLNVCKDCKHCERATEGEREILLVCGLALNLKMTEYITGRVGHIRYNGLHKPNKYFMVPYECPYRLEQILL